MESRDVVWRDVVLPGEQRGSTWETQQGPAVGIGASHKEPRERPVLLLVSSVFLCHSLVPLLGHERH